MTDPLNAPSPDPTHEALRLAVLDLRRQVAELRELAAPTEPSLPQ